MFNYSFDFHAIQNPQGPVQAFADLIIEDTLKVVGFKIMKNSQSGELWVAPPQEKSNKTDDDGKNIYFPRVYWADAKESEEDRRTKAENEVYTEMIRAFESTRSAGTRQAAAGAHAARNRGSRDNTGASGSVPRGALWG